MVIYMDRKSKKLLINNLIAKGDKRSYWEIAADLELEIWTEKHKGEEWMRQQKKK